MALVCDETDFMFPLLADIFYPVLKQSAYGQPQKDWVFDRSIACNVSGVGRQGVEDSKPNAYIVLENKLIGRVKNDIRYSSHNTGNPITGIILTNIRTENGELVYRETSGPRSGRGTIYEVATVTPFVGATNTIEYYSIVLRRAENQAVGD